MPSDAAVAAPEVAAAAGTPAQGGQPVPPTAFDAYGNPIAPGAPMQMTAPVTGAAAAPATAAIGTNAGPDPRNKKGLSSGVIMLILTVGTTAVAFADRYLNTNLTWYTGAAFVALCALCALLVRRADRWMAVFWPPLAFLVALMASGQPALLQAKGNLLIREASLLFSGLAFNAPWIFAGTLLALVIILVRRPFKD